jgi:hypothetical protein
VCLGFAVLDVVLDEVLERLQLLKELVCGKGFFRLWVAEEPGRRFDGGPPGHLIGLVVISVSLCIVERLNRVEVDVLKAVALRFVVFDPRAVPFGLLRTCSDLGPEGRVLVSVLIDEHITRVPRPCLDGLNLANGDDSLHARSSSRTHQIAHVSS